MNSVASSAIVTKLSELDAMRAKMEELQKNVETERTNALRELPKQFGYETPEDFIAAFRDANRAGGPKAAGKTNGNGKRHRATITPERRKEIQKWFKDEKGTVLEAAQTFGISTATAQNIKDEAGMVNHR